MALRFTSEKKEFRREFKSLLKLREQWVSQIERMGLFDRNDLRSCVSKPLRRLAVFDAKVTRVRKLCVVILLTILFSSWVCSSWLVVLLLGSVDINVDMLRLTNFFLISATCILAFSMYLFLMYHFDVGVFGLHFGLKTFNTLLLAGSIMFLVAGYVAFKYFIKRNEVFGHIGVGLLGASLSLGILLCGFFAIWFVGGLVKSKRRTGYPVEIAIQRLGAALLMVNGKKLGDASLRYKNKLVDDLEEVASCLERIARCVEMRDTVTSHWFEHELGQVAAWFRSLKRWVLLPKADTSSKLEEAIREALKNFALGQWDHLKKADLGSKREGLWFLVKRLLRGFLWSFTPLLTLLVVQQTPAALTANFEIARTIVFVWAVANILLSLEPNASGRVSGLRTVFDLFPWK